MILFQKNKKLCLFTVLILGVIVVGTIWVMHIGNFLRHLALPKSIKDWPLQTMREKLVKIGAKVVSYARYVTFQMAEVLVSRSLFHEILERIHRLKPVPIGYD